MFRKFVIPLMLAFVLVLACVVSACADPWVCPKCGRENAERANFCGSCREPKPVNTVIGEKNAWVCPECGEICSDEDSWCIICGTEHSDTDQLAFLVPEEPPREEMTIEPVRYEEINFSLADRNDIKEIKFTPSVSGKFCLENMNASDFSLKLKIFDPQEKCIVDYTVYKGADVLFRLEAGQEYTIRLQSEQLYNDPGTFQTRFWTPNDCTVIGEYGTVKDSLVFHKQENVYSFTAPRDGFYFFWMDQMLSGFYVNMNLVDDLGYTAAGNSVIGQGAGIGANLSAGQTYRLYIFSDKGSGEYRLNIGYPGITRDISGLAYVGDTISYKNQQNIYTYTPARDGKYTFILEKTEQNFGVRVWIVDPDGYELVSSYAIWKDRAFSADMKAGYVYTLKVVYDNGYGPYSLHIAEPE